MKHLKIAERSASFVGMLLNLASVSCILTRVEIPDHLASQVAAEPLCLDGTRYAYAFRPGHDDGRQRWVIHLQGGAWCATEEECYKRRGTGLGTSGQWSHLREPAGILSGEAPINPDMYNWNVAYLQYCDGSSFLGGQMQPMVIGGVNVYFRGHWNFEATILDLMDRFHLDKARTVVLTGCSSGALGALLNLDRLRGMMQWRVPDARVLGLSDAGWFVDTPEQIMRWQGALNLWNATSWLPAPCVETAERPWTCFFPRNVLRTLISEVFVLQPAYDGWMFGHCHETLNHSAYFIHKAFHSAIRCHHRLNMSLSHRLLFVSEEEQYQYDSSVHLCEEVTISSQEELDRGDRMLGLAAAALDDGSLEEASQMLQQSQNHFFMAGKVSLSACKEEYRCVLENGLKDLDRHAEGRSGYFSLVSDEHCVTSYDVEDWMWRGGEEFGQWLRLRLIN